MEKTFKLPFAEDRNYWKTGKSQPEVFIERAARQIENLGGKVYTHAFGQDDHGNAAYMIQFAIRDDKFKIVWPVLPSRTNNEKSARIQAATLLYHDVKATCLKATLFGARTAFFSYLMLPDGRTTAQASIPELMQDIPMALAGYDKLQIEEGN